MTKKQLQQLCLEAAAFRQIRAVVKDPYCSSDIEAIDEIERLVDLVPDFHIDLELHDDEI